VAAQQELALDTEYTRTVVCARTRSILLRLGRGFGIAPERLLTLSGIRASTLADLEARRHFFTVETAKRYAHALGVEYWTVTLLAEKGPPEPEADQALEPISVCEFTRRVVAQLARVPESRWRSWRGDHCGAGRCDCHGHCGDLE
jgi:transcriptional regulator with XRE-family HTH domain